MGYVLLVGVAALCVQLCYSSDSTCSDQTCEVMVTLDSGPVCGRMRLAENSSTYMSFQGIPYAKPPVGSRRFLAPESPDSWTEPLYAILEGPACPQRDIYYGSLMVQVRGQSEDCLYANVYVPGTVDLTDTSSIGLPILVFIHGGAFNAGSGNSDIHGPDYLVYKGVIVVTFNYRLGVLGFLSLNTTQVPGNAGLRDQIMLLNWVQKNARAFGGNPEDVTIMGQSAGSASAHLLTVSPVTEGLFHKAILLSGSALPSFYSASPSYSEYAKGLFYSYLGIDSTANAESIYEQLLDTPVNQIMYASEKLQYQTGLCTFGPTVEDASLGITRVLDDDPITLIGNGRGKDYPMLLGYTSDEAEAFRYVILVFNLVERLNQNPAIALSPRLAFSLTTEEQATAVEAVQQRYFNGTATLETMIQFLTDTYFKYAVLQVAKWRAELGGAPVYLHELSYESDFSPVKDGMWVDYKGAAHVDDLNHIFRMNSALQNHIAFPPQTKDDEMKDWMSSIIVNFTIYGNPTGMDDDVSPWPPVSSGNIYYQNTAEPAYQVTVLTTEQSEMIDFFNSIDPQAKAVTEKLSSQ